MVAAVIDRHVAAWMARPFVIGADDCAFAVRALLEETGATRVYANRVGEFRDEAAIAGFIAGETGGGGLVALVRDVARRHGWPRRRPDRAADGDIALLRAPDGLPVLGVVRGPMIVTRARPRGVVAVPRASAIVAFGVCHGA